MPKKVIEDYPLGGVHLKHSAKPPNTIRTVSGAPPVAIRTSKPLAICNIRICGDTIDGIGVGDKTRNLFNGFTIGYTINGNTGAVISSSTGAVSPYIPVDFNLTNYYISGLSDKLNSFICAYDENHTYAGRTPAYAKTSQLIQKSIFVYNTGGTTKDIAYIRITQLESANTTGKINLIKTLKTMLNTGNSTLAYEPYGYKFPLSITCAPDSSSYVFYNMSPLYAGDEIIIDPAPKYPLLYKGQNILSIDTEITPSNISVSYMHM